MWFIILGVFHTLFLLFHFFCRDQYYHWIWSFNLTWLEWQELKRKRNMNGLCLINIVYVHWSFLWYLDLWQASTFLDLNDFPQRSQGMEIPLIWLASMCCIIWFQVPCFPHTLHILALPAAFPGAALSLIIIIDLTCWFKLPMSVLLDVWSVRATAVSNVVCRTPVSIDSFLFTTLWGVCFDTLGIDGGK